MNWLLRWETLVFVAPLAFGVALVAGCAFGLGGDAEADADADADVDVDVDGDVETDAPGKGHLDVEGNGLLGLLGLGRVPLSMLLLTLSILFGTSGLAMNALLEPRLPGAFGFVSVAFAFVVSFLGTGRIAGLVARLAPTMETYRVRRQDLVGRTGRAIVELTATDGFAQVKDHEGNVQQVRVRTAGEVLPKGTSILVLEHHREGDWYLVEPFDAHRVGQGSSSVPAKAGLRSGT